MKYRGTNGSDELYGASEDNVFFMRYGGDDFVYCGAGRDVVHVNYGNAPANVSITGNFYTAGLDNLRAHIEGVDGNQLNTYGVERIIYRGSAGNEDLRVDWYDNGDANAFDLDGGDGDDRLSVDFFVKETPTYFLVGEDGIARTSAGHFQGFEHYSIRMSAGNDVAVGSANADSITGFDGDDQLSGAGGDDYLRGDLGQDRLTGGAGADVFAWTSVRESRPKSHDIVLDFSHADGDKIDLSGVDAQAGQGRDNFTFIGEAAFTGGGDYDCELRQQVNGDGTVTLLGDTNQDLKADFAIVIHTDAPLVAADLIL